MSCHRRYNIEYALKHSRNSNAGEEGVLRMIRTNRNNENQSPLKTLIMSTVVPGVLFFPGSGGSSLVVAEVLFFFSFRTNG